MAKMTSSDLVDPAVSRLKQIGDLVRRTVNDLAGNAQSGAGWLSRILHAARGPQRLAPLLMAVATISTGNVDTTPSRMLFPIEGLGAAGTAVNRTVTLQAGEAESVRFLWMQIHGLRYADEASVQVNTSAWVPLNNNTLAIAEPGRSFGGIGGGFSTLAMTLPLPNGTVVGGLNTVRFRFNQTDGFTSAYRVLAWNFLTSDGKKV